MQVIFKQQTFAAAIILFVFVASCKTDKSKLSAYGPIVENVVLQDTATFRGHNLGDDADKVMKKEPQQPLEADHNYLYYEYITEDSSATYSIAYDFDEMGLSEIQTEVFINDPEQTEQVLTNFKDYFTELYGPGQDHMGFLVWTVNSSQYGTVRINLNDQSADLGTDMSPGKISVWIYTEKE